MTWTRTTATVLALGVVGTLALVPPAVATAVGTTQPRLSATEARAEQWPLEYLDIARAHELSRGRGITIGMIDSGVDADHTDLKGVIRGGMSFGDTAGDPLRDKRNHGTGVASLIAGRGHGADNAKGILGIAPEAEIIPVKLDSSEKNKNKVSYWMGEAIQYLVDQDVDVISIASRSGHHDLGQEAVDNARDNGIPVVASAGNTVHDSGIEIDTMRTQYPGYYRDAIAVTGVDRQGEFWRYSVKTWSESDPEEIAIAAPAADIPVATADGGYEVGSGTSLSSPIVSGTFALVKARWPDLGWTELVNQVLRTADNPKGDKVTNKYGYGIVDPVAALTTDIPGHFPVDPDDAPADAGDDALPGVDEIEAGPSTTDTKAWAATPDTDDAGFPLVAALAGGGAVLLGGAGGWLWHRRQGRTTR